MKIKRFSKLCILSIILVTPITSTWAGPQYEQPNGYVLKEIQEIFSQNMQQIDSTQGYVNVTDLEISIQTEEDSLLRISYWLYIYVPKSNSCYFYVYIDGNEQNERIWVRASTESTSYEIISCSFYREPTVDRHTIDVRIYAQSSDAVYIINERYLCVEKFVPASTSANEFSGIAVSLVLLICCAYVIGKYLEYRRRTINR